MKIFVLEKIGSNGFFVFEGSNFEFGLVLVKNYAGVFGAPIPLIVLNVISGLVLIFLVWYFISIYKKAGFLYLLGLLLIIIGGESNLVDRFLYGYVIDYLKVSIWPTFNIADAMISFGVGIWIYLLIWKKEDFVKPDFGSSKIFLK